MAIKLRSFSTHSVTKTIVFILVVILITATVSQMQYVAYRDINPDCLFVREYKDSEYFFRNDVYNSFMLAYDILNGKEVEQDGTFYYYIDDGEKTYTNSENTDKSFFEQYDKAFYAFERGIWSLGRNTNPRPMPIRIMYNGLNNNHTVYIAFTDEFLEQKQKAWADDRSKLLPYAAGILSCIILSLLLIAFLVCVTGRKPYDLELHFSKLDMIYSDILLVCFIMSSIVWVVSVARSPYRRSIIYQAQPFKLSISQIYSMIWVAVITAVISVVCGLILLSVVRRIKAGRLIKHSIIFIILYKVYDFFKSLFDGRMFSRYPLTKSLFYRQVAFITASALLMFLAFLSLISREELFFLIFGALEFPIIYWYIKGNNKTYEDINKGFNESLEEQMRSERMKIDLVTNVSHDLKTPLTSIISYVDLLSKEEGLSESAGDYVKILSEKSNRLKHIVSDLFDLAKSTSGNIQLDLENIDIKKLIEQTLADMSSEIEKSGLAVKVKLPEKSVNIISDGKKLYRVFQNVIDNALKYSLSGTRVFVELEEADGRAIATIKNTAGYEMDFTSDEILQRFNRGDKSRTTEGSGLGLSIAESFSKVCGGSFKVDIDGDLFKVTIGFNIDSRRLLT